MLKTMEKYNSKLVKKFGDMKRKKGLDEKFYYIRYIYDGLEKGRGL